MKPFRMERVVRVIETLSDGQFHSGEELGMNLGVSRTAISQYIKDVQMLGLDVFRVTGKGYRLAAPVQLLELNKIQSHLQSNGQTSTDISLERVVTSTNDTIKQALKYGVHSGYAVLAEAQTQGRGRRGKRWLSPFASNLYMSMYWRLERGMVAAMGLSLVVGTIIGELLFDMGVYDVELKWPNDVMVNNKKIAGILIELEGQALDTAHVIIGVGLNVAIPPYLNDKIDQPWTDLNQVLSRAVDRNVVAAALITKTRVALEEYSEHGLTAFLARWSKFDRLAKKPVRIIMGQQVLDGIAEGIDETGALLVKRNGKLERFHAGEVSLRYDV